MLSWTESGLVERKSVNHLIAGRKEDWRGMLACCLCLCCRMVVQRFRRQGQENSGIPVETMAEEVGSSPYRRWVVAVSVWQESGGMEIKLRQAFDESEAEGFPQVRFDSVNLLKVASTPKALEGTDRQGESTADLGSGALMITPHPDVVLKSFDQQGLDEVDVTVAVEGWITELSEPWATKKGKTMRSLTLVDVSGTGLPLLLHGGGGERPSCRHFQCHKRCRNLCATLGSNAGSE